MIDMTKNENQPESAVASSDLLGWFGRQDVDAIFTALASPALSDASNPSCCFAMDDAVWVWMQNTMPHEWIPKLCDELNRMGFSIVPNAK